MLVRIIAVAACVVSTSLMDKAGTQSVEPKCEPGTFRNSTSGSCDPCLKGSFTTEYNRAEHCSLCTECTHGRNKISECTNSSDTVCDCPSGFYYDGTSCALITADTSAAIIDNCSLRLDKIAKSFDALRQSLNGTAEKALLEAALSEVRMVKRNLASVAKEANRTSSTQNEIFTMVSGLTRDSPKLKCLLSTVLSIVVLHLMLTVIPCLRDCKREKSVSAGMANENERTPLRSGTTNETRVEISERIGNSRSSPTDVRGNPNADAISATAGVDTTVVTDAGMANENERTPLRSGTTNETRVAKSADSWLSRLCCRWTTAKMDVKDLAKRLNTAVYGTEHPTEAQAEVKCIMVLLKDLAEKQVQADVLKAIEKLNGRFDVLFNHLQTVSTMSVTAQAPGSQLTTPATSNDEVHPLDADTLASSRVTDVHVVATHAITEETANGGFGAHNIYNLMNIRSGKEINNS